MYKTIEDLYPLTIVCDRYGGAYSGGKYTAWLLDPWDVPAGIEECDFVCRAFWEKNDEPVGIADTPIAAMENLRVKVNEFLEKNLNEL